MSNKCKQNKDCKPKQGKLRVCSLKGNCVYKTGKAGKEVKYTEQELLLCELEDQIIKKTSKKTSKKLSKKRR